MGGLNICIPKELAKDENANSRTATEPIVRAVSEQRRVKMDECAGEAMRIRNDLKSKMRKQVQEKTETRPRPCLRQNEASNGYCQGEGCL